MGVKINKKSLSFYTKWTLRFIPLLALSWLPLKWVDSKFLALFYDWKGTSAARSDLTVIKTSAYTQDPNFLKIVEAYKGKAILIVNLNSKNPPDYNVLDLYLDDKFSLDSIFLLRERIRQQMRRIHFLHPATLDHKSSDQNTNEFYGDINSFNVHNSQDFKMNHNTIEPNVLIFIPDANNSATRINTPVGLLTPFEIAINMIASETNSDFVRTESQTTKIILSLLLSLFCFLTFSKFSFLTASLQSISFLILVFLTTYFVFIMFSVHVPMASALLTFIASLFLALGDKLDRREKKNWLLLKSNEQLQQVDDIRNHFLSLVSHDLKTPLASMRATIERFLKYDFGPINSEQNAQLKKLIEKNGFLEESIHTLLLLTRIETGDIQLQLKPTDINQILNNLLESKQGLILEKKLIVLRSQEPLFLSNLDSKLMEQVISNLLDNAIKFSNPGGQLTIKCYESESPFEGMASPLVLEIQDEGPGIPPRDRAKIGEKFFRSQYPYECLDFDVKGTGLGFYLCKYFIEKHRGKIKIFSKIQNEVLPPEHILFKAISGTLIRVYLPKDL